MNSPVYTKHERLWLKGHPEFGERWLQDRIAEDPSILGLGDVMLMDRERSQERAGRLDLLLSDIDENLRYEVELMLGPTDESHIIRCIEYWDIERRRYPGYEHCAVLVAEDITSRFLNVLALFAGTIPLVAIQLNALVVDVKILLDFVKVLDQRLLRRDENEGAMLPPVDKSYWIQKSSGQIMEVADDLLAVINQKAEPKQQLNFNKGYVGLTDGSRSRNFIYFKPMRKQLRIVFRNGWNEERFQRLDEAGLEAYQKGEKLLINLAPSDLKKNLELITSLIHEVVEEQK